jgi:hypothetical protein
MRALFRAYASLTGFLGSKRRIVRRVAALCLVVLGVHAAADLFDDVLFRLLDALDLFVDNTVWHLLEKLASWGAFSPADAARHAQGFAEAVDVDHKDRMSRWLALGVELGVDLLVVDFVLGPRGKSDVEAAGGSLVEELKASSQALRDALWPLDLERLAAPPALFCFACAGTLFGALALESAVSDLLSTRLPRWRWGPNASASLALVFAAVLLWRFLPDLLHGAILRAAQRGQQAAERLDTEPPPRTRLALARGVLRRLSRGALLFFVVLPLAIAGLSTQSDILALVARTGTGL